MYTKPEAPQQWSVHAEFTISHPGGVDTENLPQTRTEQGDNGVRMTYTWTSGSSSNNASWPSPPLSASNSHRSTQSEKAYGFQKGNLLFTSTPPKRPLNFPEISSNRLLGVQDSGYGSDLLSPNSLGNGGLRRPIQPYNRKCRSTCNIVLSANVVDENRTTEEQHQHSVDSHTQCGRTQSLRCQTPTLRCDRKDSFYGCGDPWCHHIHYGDDFAGRISPVLETCEDVNSEQNVGNVSAQSTRCGSSVPRETRRDACVQTFEMIDKCTSPFLKYSKEGKEKKLRKYGGRRKTEPIFQRSNTPSSITPDSLDNSVGSQKMGVRRSSRSKEQQRTSKDRESTVDSNKSSDLSKKPRTVHIDVYCTGTEMESSNSSNNNDSSDNDTASTPQTVFESQKVRITHQRAKDEQLPFNVRKSKSNEMIKKKIEEKQQEESDDEDDDDVSSAYPSKLSSYSTIRDFSSSISSVPKSWTTYSMSSCAVPDDYDSVANTSWKDTFSDIESLLQSRSSIAQTESLDFVPRKLYQKNASIDETPEIENKSLLETPSVDSLQASDSFEYANSEDRLRISKMEELWKTPSPKPKTWKSPQAERRHLLQQQKIQEYLQKRESSDKILPKWESRDSDSDASDGSGKAYTFVKNSNSSNNVEKKKEKEKLTSESFTSKSPSILALQQRFSMDPSLRAPFTIVPGIYTDQRAIAKKFGSILPVVRKPGHHIGPVKNPDCLCDHCQRYYANLGYRTRTRSMGDPTSFQPVNWKDFQNYPTAESNSNRSVPSQLFTDF